MADALSRRRVSVFGSTGSIGCNTVDLLKHQGGREAYEVVALSGSGNVGLLAEQARALGARLAVTAQESLLGDLRDLLRGTGVEAAAGKAALRDAAAEVTDWTMSAIVGAAGLEPSLAAARNGGTLALANKESLVAAGELLLAECQTAGTRLIPTDSEHSAIFQTLAGHEKGDLERIILTASGGPFRTWSLAEMAAVTPEMARAHPNWTMGARITVDSASMFNKALELIETKHLFETEPEQIEVIVHPQSLVHSMVGFRDGAILAHLGPPDMRGAIGYALNWPDRRDLPVERLDFTRHARLDFEPADPQRFPALRLAREVLAAGGLSGAAFIAAKDFALDLFLAGRIGFTQMAERVEKTLEILARDTKYGHSSYVLEDVAAMDAEARRVAAGL